MCSSMIICPTILSKSNPNPELQARMDRLSVFVQWALRQSESDRYSPQQAQQLRDRAREAQKLLWEMRYHA